MDTAIVRPLSYADLESHPDFPGIAAEYSSYAIADLVPVNPHHEMYRAMEQAGIMQVFGAFVGSCFAGYAILLVTVLPHYSAPVATLESFFVSAMYRHTGAGLKLLRAAEAAARDKGAVGLLVSAPIGGQLAEVMARMRSYRETNRVFFRSLTC